MNSFDEDYFLRGKETGVSNFTDYKWMPDSTISMVAHLTRYLDIKKGDRVLDYGCARGFYVKALRMLGVEAFGCDISEWAIANCDPEVKPFVSNYLNGAEYDFVFSKDVFEHIPFTDLGEIQERLQKATKKKLFLIVPLAEKTGGQYVHPKEENDKTHVNRWTLPDWLQFLQVRASGFLLSAGYKYPGLKPGCYEVECGYGFITLERI